MCNEVLGSKKTYCRLNEILGRMSTRRIFLMGALVATGVILAACGYTPTTQPKVTETAPGVSETTTPVVTEVAPGVTETATAEPTAVPTETEAPAEVKHPEFSREYQPAYIEHHEVVVQGITMNIDWGLSHWVTARPEKPVSEIHIAPDIAPMVGELFLKSCWYRFTHFMPGNESVTYEQYVELEKQGKGDISFVAYDEVNGGRWPVETSFDPAEGFALSLVDESLPIKIHDKSSTYYGSDGTGRLFIANKLDKAMVSRYSGISYEDKWLSIFRDLLSDSLGDLLSIENKCFVSADVQSACGYPSFPIDKWKEFFQPILNEMMLQHNEDRDPIFWVVEK